MSRGKKEQNLTPVSNVLESLFVASDGALSDQFRRYQLWQKWFEVVGPQVSSYSAPVKYREGILWVWVRTPAHMQDLTFGLEVLRGKVNQFFGFVWAEHIKLTVDRQEVEPVPRP